VFNAPPFDKRFDYVTLFETDISPVCAPDAVNTIARNANLGELKKSTLLSAPCTWNEPDDWDYWLHKVGLDKGEIKFGSIFDNYPLVREAVLKTRGIGMARAPYLSKRP
jgi:LysR family glycine cleavage system transcriptional activator